MISQLERDIRAQMSIVLGDVDLERSLGLRMLTALETSDEEALAKASIEMDALRPQFEENHERLMTLLEEANEQGYTSLDLREYPKDQGHDA